MQRLPWAHLQDTVTRQVIPRLPKEWLLAVAGISTVEVVKREIAAQVSALPLPVRHKTEVLLNQTYTSLELKVNNLTAQYSCHTSHN
jgi:predicted RNA polymerase sigma factor